MNHASHLPSPAVVVGIDGSRAAITAALWAVDEAVSRDVPLRLLYAIEPRTPLVPNNAAHDLATAEIAVRAALTAVESLERPVKVEVEIVQDHAHDALITASRSAALICVGALGRDHAAGRRVGSVAAALSRSVRCPVAIIRRHDPVVACTGWVVAEVDESPESTWVLDAAVAEAQLRQVPLRVLATWQSRLTDGHDPLAVADNNRATRIHLERRLTRWRRLHPDLDVVAVSAHGTTAKYLAQHADAMQLLVVSQQRAAGLDDVAGSSARAALHDTSCSILVCQRHGVL